MIFNNVAEPLDQLELIDQLQRVGVDYHYRDEINRALKSIHQNAETWEKDLHATALEFRLLRQHGHYISPGKIFQENLVQIILITQGSIGPSSIYVSQ